MQKEFSFIKLFEQVLDDNPILNTKFRQDVPTNDCLYYTLKCGESWPLDPWNRPWKEESVCEFHSFSGQTSWIQHTYIDGYKIRCCISNF